MSHEPKNSHFKEIVGVVLLIVAIIIIALAIQ